MTMNERIAHALHELSPPLAGEWNRRAGDGRRLDCALAWVCGVRDTWPLARPNEALDAQLELAKAIEEFRQSMP